MTLVTDGNHPTLVIATAVLVDFLINAGLSRMLWQPDLVAPGSRRCVAFFHLLENTKINSTSRINPRDDCHKTSAELMAGLSAILMHWVPG